MPRASASQPAIIVLCIAVLLGVFVWSQFVHLPGTRWEGRWLLPDPDDYMRLYRVRMILDGRATIVRNIPELHPPQGTELHWTAPLDYLILGAVKIFSGGVDARTRLMPLAAWLPVVLGAVYLAAAMTLLWRALGPAVALLAGLMLAVSPGVGETFRLGHSDHHCLLELCLMLSLYCWLVPRSRRERVGNEPSCRAVVISGVCIGMAIWVSVLAVVTWALILAGATFATVHASADRRAIWARRRLQWSAAALAVVVTGWGIEDAPHLWRLSVDKISVLHAAMLGVALLLPAGSVRNRFGSGKQWLLFAAAAGFLTTWIVYRYDAATAIFHRPEFYRWSSVVAELQPLILRAANGWSIMPLLRYLGLLPFFVPIGLWLLRGDERLTSMAKASFGLLAAFVTGLAIAQLRWADHVMMTVAPVTALALTQLAGRWFPGAVVCRVVFLLAGTVVLIFISAAGVLTPPSGKPDPFMTRLVKAIDAIKEHQRKSPLKPSCIMCEYDAGPILLYETGLPVVAGPYHRCIDGIADVTRFFSERDDAEARAEMAHLGIGYVVVPYAPANQLWMYERIAYGELRSYAKAELALKDGEPYERIEMKPDTSKTVVYRLAQCVGTEGLGVTALLKIDEGASTPDRLSGLVYVVRD